MFHISLYELALNNYKRSDKKTFLFCNHSIKEFARIFINTETYQFIPKFAILILYKDEVIKGELADIFQTLW